MSDPAAIGVTLGRELCLLGLLCLLAIAAGGCGEKQDTLLSAEALQDPEACKDCHKEHYREWSGSMHAYASQDPVFRAMNARGQQETNGVLGDFCVNCHAPLAVRLGLTTDGLNLDQVPAHLQGITCYFCHNIQDVPGMHNNPIVLANDNTMRGGIRDPVPSAAHNSAYSPFMDGNTREGSTACGACHDIEVPVPPGPGPKPVALERTFKEWQNSVFAHTNTGCSVCHMPIGIDPVPVAEAPGVQVRPGFPHSHAFPGVDMALEPFPEQAEQKRLIERELDSTVRVAELCVTRLRTLYVDLENAGAGHRWPSGAAQDRRAWVEIIAYKNGQPIWQTGVVQDGEAVVGRDDPELWIFRDEIFGAQNQPVHMFWEVARIEQSTMLQPVTANMGDARFWQTHSRRFFPASGTLPELPDRVTVRVRMRPMGLDVLDDLIKTGHLAPPVRNAIPTIDLLPERATLAVSAEWTRDQATSTRVGESGIPGWCVYQGVKM